MPGAILLAPRIFKPAAARAQASEGSDPRPIPGGLVVAGQGYHVFLPGHSNPADPSSPINEPSTIFDFDGVVALAHVQGTGSFTDATTGLNDQPVAFEADMRIMKGRYVSEDGQTRADAFGFI